MHRCVGATSARCGRLRVLIFGGSQGAHAINVAAVEAAPRAGAARTAARRSLTRPASETWRWCGRGYERAGLVARVEPFLYEMDREMKAARPRRLPRRRDDAGRDHRGGRASVLVPLPTATDDHQRKNAEVLAQRGRGRGDRPARADGRPAGGRGSRRSRDDPERPRARWPDAARDARAARRGARDRRPGARAGGRGTGADAAEQRVLGRTTADALHRRRRQRHERDRRGAAPAGYAVSGSDVQALGRDERLADARAGVSRGPRRRARRRRGRRRGLVGGAADEPGGRRGAAARASP